MPVKDRVVTWWIQNVITPRREIIDKPGFVITTFTDRRQTTYLRDLFLPEKLFELIENRIVEKYGDQGRLSLYSAGKKNGYIYAMISNFPTIKNRTQKELADFAYLFVRYCETTFAKQATHELDLEQKIFTITYNDYIICRHNGIGHIMTEGGSAGIWAYVMQDKSIESVQLECQGRGNQRCYVICAPEQKIQEKKNNYFQVKDLPEQKFDKVYKTLNEIRKTTHAQNSLRKLIDAGFFNYHEGILSYKNMRFFGCEANIFYLLEQEITKLQGGEQILFDACFEYGKLLQETYGFTSYEKFIQDFFPALGFGEVFVLDPNVPSITAVYYPWTIYSEQSTYIIFRGILSGFISNCLGKHIELKNQKIIVREFLTLIFTP